MVERCKGVLHVIENDLDGGFDGEWPWVEEGMVRLGEYMALVAEFERLFGV